MANANFEEEFTFLSINPNKIFWDHVNNIGFINHPKGNIWNTIGVINSGKAQVYADEAFFLSEFHEFEILDDLNLLDSASSDKQKCNVLSIIDKDCGLVSYKLFKTLKKHGYVLLRPESKYFPRIRLFESLRAEYSIFKPSSTFKKTNPSGLIGCVYEIKCEDKVKFILEKIGSIPETAILAISDEMNGFCFLSATSICPSPTRIESSSIQLKQSKSQKSTVH